jgi:hypothetical protein
MTGRQIVAGACIGFVAMTLISLSARTALLPYLNAHSQSQQMFYFGALQALSAVVAALLAWGCSRVVKDGVIGRIAALVLFGYLIGEILIFLNEQVAGVIVIQLGRAGGLLSFNTAHTISRLVGPLLFAVVLSLLVLARRKTAKGV